MKPSAQKHVIPLLRSSVSTLIVHKQILLPFVVIAFFQFLLLQIIYFSPRYPLNKLFGPLIGRIWSEQYMHYPYNFLVLPRIFSNSIIQAAISIFISSYFIACSISIIEAINKDHTIKMRKIFKGNAKIYFRIVVVAALYLAAIKLLFLVAGKLSERASMIRSTSGMFYMLKGVVLTGEPYLKLFFSVLVTTLFAYVLPGIIIDKRRIFQSLVHNFRVLFGSFWFTFRIILIPELLFIPVILLRGSLSARLFFPELTIFVLILNILVTVVIYAVIHVSVTIYYLVLKEH